MIFLIIGKIRDINQYNSHRDEIELFAMERV